MQLLLKFHIRHYLPFIRYFFNSSSLTCQQFEFGGCNGNENRFDDIEICNNVCRDKQAKSENVTLLKTGEFSNFEDGFGSWNVYGWRNFYYDSSEALNNGIEAAENDNAVCISF